jgi:cytochrome c oxidase subunit 2
MPMPRVRLPRFAPALALLLVAAFVAGCQALDPLYPPQAVTEQGTSTRNLYDIVFAIAVAIFVLVEGLILWAVIRYRRKPTDTDLPPQIHGNNLVEVIWTVIPTLIVAFLFVVSWQTLNVVDGRSSDPQVVHIRAVAARFQWTFEYLSPDGGQVVYTQIAPEMYVPAGETVRLSLRSPDVIHAFYVPQFLFKRDVVPGKENVFDFKVEAADAGQVFNGQCAELCGAYHDAMRFTVHALAPAEFEAWLQTQIAAARATPAPAASPSVAPSGSPSAGQPGASPGGPAGQVTVEVSATNIAYDQTSISAPANTPFTIRFQNNDAGIPHNIVIHDGTSISDPALFDGEIFNGVDSRLYPVPALKPGTYLFSCKVHPNMTGTLTVQ